MVNDSQINVRPVILCGGSGTRLWPISRTGFPKQFLIISGTTSLFQQTVNRVNLIASENISIEETLVVTAEEHRFIASEQLREVAHVSSKILLEPEGKNTAPALTLAALCALKNGDDPVLFVTPADQTVQNEEQFSKAMRNAVKVAASGAISLLGIKPSAPKTGFGYIKHSGAASALGDFKVEKFVEKPDEETAQSYLCDEGYSWNSGIFVVRASVWINAIKNFREDILISTKKAFNQSKMDNQFVRPDRKLFIEVPSESIDYAVMERCPDSEFEIRVLPLDVGWNDLGNWDAVWEVGEKDQNFNVIKGDTLLENSKNNLIHSNHRLVSAIGVDNLVIVETSDAVLVADRSQSQHVKNIVSQLARQSREERVLHRKVFRPWGWYDTIDVGNRFKVKHILVNPGASLSLQKHAKRAEHWVVVKGNAQIICGDKSITLKENQSTFIPLGELHRLSNPSTEALEIIEVQSGNYLGEDDIIRVDDGYGRK